METFVSTSTLAEALGDLSEDAVVEGVREALASGASPQSLLQELQAGMTLVGERFESGEYFLSELVYSTDIFKTAMAPLQDGLREQAAETHGTIVLGTAKKDIHDFGKDIVATVMGSNGFKVVDLGVDVEPQAFVDAIREHKPELVGISCLLTTAFPEMKTTIDRIADAGLRDRVTILIGGGSVDQACCEYVGADIYCETAQDGVAAAKKTLGVE
jgi:dimethylamine corrinoid protein